MEKQKTMQLVCEQKTFTDPTTKDTRKYWSWYVVLAGVKVYLKPTERLGYQLLQNVCDDVRE